MLKQRLRQARSFFPGARRPASADTRFSSTQRTRGSQLEQPPKPPTRLQSSPPEPPINSASAPTKNRAKRPFTEKFPQPSAQSPFALRQRASRPLFFRRHRQSSHGKPFLPPRAISFRNTAAKSGSMFQKQPKPTSPFQSFQRALPLNTAFLPTKQSEKSLLTAEQAPLSP